jgi:hypothetical protein
MPSLVTDNFRVFAAQQFVESLEEPYNSSFNPASEDAVNNSAEAQASQKYRSKVYLFIGRSYNWNDTTAGAVGEKYSGYSTISDFAPPDPVDCQDEINEIYDDMIAIKRITRSDISEVIRKRTWQSGIVYDMYRHDYGTVNSSGVTKISATGQSKLYDSSFYVMTDDYRVYKCIYNGQTPSTEAYPNGKPSTSKPTGTDPGIITYADGYRWKYMYTISINDYIKFVSTDFIPVKFEAAVQSAAVSGAINQVNILDRGSGLTPGPVLEDYSYYVPVIGNGGLGLDSTKAILKVKVPDSGAFANKIESVTAVQAGTDYTYGSVDLTACYSSLANALARTGTTTSLGTVAKLDIIISPEGGHGSNPIYELGAYRIMINKNLEFLDGDGDIPVNMQFRRFGLIEDPQSNSNSDYIATTAIVCKAMRFPSTTTVNFDNGEIITQQNTGAKGRVIHWDSVNKILRYYQNEYISNQQTGTNKNKLVEFSGNNSVSQANGVSATPDVTVANYPVTVAGVTFSNTTPGYTQGEIKKNSGKVLYVENRKPVFRSNDQIEDVKLVIEF